MSLRFEKTYQIAADLDLVWECIADADTCSLWQGGDCTIGTSVGEEVSIFGGSVTGKILAIDEEKLLKYSWRGDSWQEDWEDSTVEYRFVEGDGEVSVTVIHDKFPNEKERESHALGWDTYFFEPMIEFITESME
ncbi:MAG: SRPBCC domain-containing protein [Candidatus Kariarchaeaceae archaeon]|jgi:uncharacterized protein YndB with AHSA1/START domain